MIRKKTAAAAVLAIALAGATPLLEAGVADASPAPAALAAPAAPAADAAASGLHCTTTTGHTGGTATCTGTGTWRIHMDCAAEPDKVGSWITQHGGTVRRAGPQCTFENRHTSVQKA